MTQNTKKTFLDDAYLSVCDGRIVEINELGGIILDQTNFYATSGGQPGDNGHLELDDGSGIPIVTTVNGANKNEIILIPEEGQQLPPVGTHVVGHINWERRYDLMRMHTACHLLSVLCPYPVTGASVGEEGSRIDFEISESDFDKCELTRQLMEMVSANYPVYDRWISEAELAANPDLVKSKNVRPPSGMGDIRLVCIGENALIDSQPCGGTHVSETQEIGDIHISKIEKKGKENRRFRLRFGPLTS